VDADVLERERVEADSPRLAERARSHRELLPHERADVGGADALLEQDPLMRLAERGDLVLVVEAVVAADALPRPAPVRGDPADPVVDLGLVLRLGVLLAERRVRARERGDLALVPADLDLDARVPAAVASGEVGRELD